MIADIANELHRVRRKVRGGVLMEHGARITDTVKTTTFPEWMIDRALRVEVNEYDFYEHCWRNGGEPPPTEISGVSIYLIPARFEQLPAPGWRIINPFEQPTRVPNYGSPFMAPERG